MRITLLLSQLKMSESRKRLFCPHCDEFVSKSTLYHHRSLYYREDIGEPWMNNDKQGLVDIVGHSIMHGGGDGGTYYY